MTEKQEIIITGVDVSECEFFDGSHLCQCDKTIIDEHKKLRNIFSVNCRDNYNCYFKQLARKTQECEQKEKRNAVLFLMSNRYRKALEEIEKYTRKQFCDNCEDIGSTEYNCHCEYCEYQEYFDIINKAKRQ